LSVVDVGDTDQWVVGPLTRKQEQLKIDGPVFSEFFSSGTGVYDFLLPVGY